MGEHRRRGLWWAVFAPLAVACAAWGLSLPLLSGPDEYDHAVRAAAVARAHPLAAGHPEGNLIGYVEAPRAYADAGDIALCWYLKGEPREARFDDDYVPAQPDDCGEMDHGGDVVPVPTYEYRSQPVYYFVVGLPSLASPGPVGVYLGRLVAGLLCAAFLASGLTTLLRNRARPLVVLGATVALTPAVLYFSGILNPVGLEIATAFAAWSGVAALASDVSDGREESDGALVRRTGVALVVLALTRGLSPLFAVLALAALVVMASGTRRRELLARRDVRAWLGATGVAVVASGAWLLFIHERYPLPHRAGTGLTYALGQLPWWGQEVAAVFGATTVVPPAGLHLVWLLAAVLVAVVALSAVLGSRTDDARGERRAPLLGLALVLLSVGLLVSGEGFSVPQTGFWWQGRYVLPLLVGAPLLVTWGTSPDDGDTARLLRRFGPSLLVTLVAVQVWCFAYAIRHYAVGHDGPLNPSSILFDAGWSPPLLPAWLYLVVFGAAMGLLSVRLWRAVTPTDGTPDELAGTRRPASKVVVATRP